MLFRKTNRGDIDRIMEIVSCARESLAKLNIDQWQYGYPLKETFEQDCQLGHSYVVERSDGVVIGTTMVGFEGEPTYDHIDGAWMTAGSSKNPTYGVLHRVTTCPIHKEQGTAVFLFEQAEHMAMEQGCKSIRIDTHEGNIPMRKLLEKCGYTECGFIYLTPSEGGDPKRVAYEKIL